MDVVPFVHEGLGNSSYLVEVGHARAVLVDPDRDVARYVDDAASRGWDIVGVFETHLHADFVTGSLEVAHATGATIHLPADAGVGFAHRGLGPGDRVGVGDVEVEAVASPGHTPEHLSYVLRADRGAPSLFSGGALMPGGAARTDLIGPELTEALTRSQYRTLHEAFVELPDETPLFPTHGRGSFCSVSSGGGRTSTLGVERRSNPLLAREDEEEFVRWFPSTFPAVPSYFSRMRGVNKAGPRLRESIQPPPPLSPGEFDEQRERGAMVVDVRPYADYSAGHVPGSLLIPFRAAYATWLGWLVPADAPLLFVADGVPMDRVVDQSLLVGYERFAGYLEGGIDAWRRAGRPVERAGTMDPADALRAVEDGAIVLDVREPDEFAAGHVRGAVHIPLGQLEARLSEVPGGRPIVAYCGHGERSGSGLSILERAGVGSLFNLAGGFGAWKEAGYRVSG